MTDQELRLTLVTGGIKSGKSEHAEKLAAELGERIAYVATGAPSDAEMQDRIDAHRRRRPKSWITLEPGSQTLAGVVRPVAEVIDGILLDDLGGLVTTALIATRTIAEADAWLARDEEAFWELLATTGLPAIVVTSEVGLSLVPTNDLARRFTDVLGSVNQRWAARARSLILVVAGVPLRLK